MAKEQRPVAHLSKTELTALIAVRNWKRLELDIYMGNLA